MSEWYEVNDDDIDVNYREVDILVTDNDSGNIYVTLTYEQVQEICNKFAELRGNK